MVVVPLCLRYSPPATRSLDPILNPSSYLILPTPAHNQPVFYPGLTLSWAIFRVFSSIQGILLRRVMRASLMAVNKSMAYGCEKAVTEKQDEDQSWSWVLPTLGL